MGSVLLIYIQLVVITVELLQLLEDGQATALVFSHTANAELDEPVYYLLRKSFFEPMWNQTGDIYYDGGFLQRAVGPLNHLARGGILLKQWCAVANFRH